MRKIVISITLLILFALPIIGQTNEETDAQRIQKLTELNKAKDVELIKKDLLIAELRAAATTPCQIIKSEADGQIKGWASLLIQATEKDKQKALKKIMFKRAKSYSKAEAAICGYQPDRNFWAVFLDKLEKIAPVAAILILKK